MSPPALRRYRAERLLRKDFPGLRSKVLAIVRSQLRVKGIALDAGDLEGCYAQAWQGLYATVLGGEQVENPRAWLVLVTLRRAIDESRAAGRRQLGRARPPVALHSDAGAPVPGGAQDLAAAAFDPDLAGELDRRERLRQVFEGLRTRLSARECEAASLCYLHGFSRAEAAERMGISAARMGKLMEGAGPGRPGVAGKVGDLLDTIREGGWCEQQSSLMRAFAFGILDPEGERHALAVAHCRECPACRAHVASLRGLAAVLPLPLLSPLALAGGTGAAAGRSAAGTGNGLAGGSASSTPLASRWVRVGGRAGRGWSGVPGSLAAKLAVSGLAVLGGGYALLGSRVGASPGGAVHGSPLASPVVGVEARGRALFSAPPTRARGARLSGQPRTRRATASHARSAPGAHSNAEAPPREFAPERVPREAANARSVVTPAPSRNPSSRTAGEFGIE